MKPTSTIKPEAKTGCIMCLIALALFAPATIWRGYVLTRLWVWFVIPAFNVEPIRIPVAIGLSLIVSYLTHQIPPEDHDSTPAEKYTRTIAIPILFPAFALFGGWIVNHWM